MVGKQAASLKNAMNYGAVIGLILIIISVLFYMFSDSMSAVQTYIGYAVLIAGIVIGTKNYRDTVLGGYIDYGQCLGSGTLIAFFSAIIMAFYTYIFFTFIDASLIDILLEQIEEQMIENGSSDEEIEIAMSYTSKFMTPFWMSIGSVFSYTFWGFVFSLIISFFIKRKDESFESITDE